MPAPAAPLLAVALALGGSPLELAAPDPFPVLGATLALELSGPPAAPFAVHGGPQPTQVALPGLGTLFVDPAGLVPLASGALSPAGEATVVLPVPTSPGLDGKLFHLQAGALDGAAIVLSGSVTVRFGTAAPADPRHPESVAATPDGTKLYVGHEEDGSVTVVDPAARAVLREVPVVPPPSGQGLPVRVAVDPEGRHAFVVEPWARELAVLDVATDSVVARLPVPLACRDVAFDFGATDRVYVTSERDRALLVLDEVLPGVFVPGAPVPLAGEGPGPLVVLDDGRVVVGHRTTHELELVDPAAPSPTVARLPLGRIPFDLAVVGGALLVAGHDPEPGDGLAEVLEVDLATFAVVGAHLRGLGTDYVDLAPAGASVGVVAAGSGALLVADAATLALDHLADLAPGQPLATPQQAALAGGELWVANPFRESLVAVDVATGALAAEVAVGHGGSVLLPLVHLSPEDDGEWFFRSVEAFGGAPTLPNPVTCATCHPYGASSDGLADPRQAMPLFHLGETAPYGSKGGQPTLAGVVDGPLAAHGIFGGPHPLASSTMQASLADVPAPSSPFLAASGALTPEQEAGRALFEGAAGCAACHPAPLHVPEAPAPKTIAAGVGTGLAPANVPSLRGVWATGPYLHDHSAASLAELLELDTGDLHGTTAGLSAAEVAQLVAYLRTL